MTTDTVVVAAPHPMPALACFQNTRKGIDKRYVRALRRKQIVEPASHTVIPVQM